MRGAADIVLVERGLFPSARVRSRPSAAEFVEVGGVADQRGVEEVAEDASDEPRSRLAVGLARRRRS